MNLISAVKNNNIAVVEKLILQGKFVDERDSEGSTLLSNASGSGFLEIAAFLIKHNADVNSINNYGNSPLYRAASRGHEEIVSMLLAYGANTNVQNKEGKYPSLIASNNKHNKVLSMILRHEEIMESAKQGNFDPVVTYLNTFKDVATTNNRKYSDVLRLAAQKGKLGILKALLETQNQGLPGATRIGATTTTWPHRY